MTVLDQDKFPRKLVWGATALALAALIAIYYKNNEPQEVPGYSQAAATPITPGSAQQSQ
ncbi:MAG TPA: hypothetical protein VIN59_05950 [Alphaproteobacteria bacterium]